jgi:hypothetical protein
MDIITKYSELIQGMAMAIPPTRALRSVLLRR